MGRSDGTPAGVESGGRDERELTFAFGEPPVGEGAWVIALVTMSGSWSRLISSTAAPSGAGARTRRSWSAPIDSLVLALLRSLAVAKDGNDRSRPAIPHRAFAQAKRRSRAGPSGFREVPSGLSALRTAGTPRRELAQIWLEESVLGLRSGAGVEPTEPWVARPHRF